MKAIELWVIYVGHCYLLRIEIVWSSHLYLWITFNYWTSTCIWVIFNYKFLSKHWSKIIPFVYNFDVQGTINRTSWYAVDKKQHLFLFELNFIYLFIYFFFLKLINIQMPIHQLYSTVLDFKYVMFDLQDIALVVTTMTL